MLGAEEFAKLLSRGLAGGGVLRDRSQRCRKSGNCTRGFGGKARNWQTFLNRFSALRVL
jgi:hypothetical protein